MKVALGIGCDRGASLATIDLAVDEALARAGVTRVDVGAVASIDLKANEAGLLALAEKQGWTIIFYTATELAEVVVPNPSETVRKYTGTPSVSEAAALLVARAKLPNLLVEKIKSRGRDGRHATVSVARCTDQEVESF
ncbi:MAG: cobalamin biosynthesis protein [Burkholderiaceae bacterium]|nr:cobalamin biosynthesis protein [Burkholderiaceae bacterium]